MRSTLPTLVAGLVLAPLAALAQADAPRAVPIPGVAPGTRPGSPAELPRLVIGAPGRCELSSGGRPQPCISGLVYVQNRDGAILISVQSTAASTIGFQAESESRPRPEEVTLNLSRMHTAVNGNAAAKTVTGTCQISMTADGLTWHRATCRATDGNGLTMVMSFTGDGRPVSVARPGGAPDGKPAPALPPKG